MQPFTIETLLLGTGRRDVLPWTTDCSAALGASSAGGRSAVTGDTVGPSRRISPSQLRVVGQWVAARMAGRIRLARFVPVILLVVAAIIANIVWGIFGGPTGGTTCLDFSQTCYRTPMYQYPSSDNHGLITILDPGTGLYVDCWTTGPVVDGNPPGNPQGRKTNDIFWEKVSWTSEYRWRYTGYVPDYDINTGDSPPSRHWSHCT